MPNEATLTDRAQSKKMKIRSGQGQISKKRRHDEGFFFSDEKLFDVDGIYNSENCRILAVDRAQADIKGAFVNFLERWWFGLECVRKDFRLYWLIGNGTVDHNCYINEVLQLALKYDNNIRWGWL